MVKTVLESLMAKQRFHWEGPKIMQLNRLQWHNTHALHVWRLILFLPGPGLMHVTVFLVLFKGTRKYLTYLLGSHSTKVNLLQVTYL